MPSATPIHDVSAQCFRLSLPEGEVRLDYRRLTPGWVDFHHTFTPVALRGRGLAGEVVAAGLDWAEAESLRVVASCSYVAAALAQRSTRERG
jgi:hypothetical protein